MSMVISSVLVSDTSLQAWAEGEAHLLYTELITTRPFVPYEKLLEIITRRVREGSIAYVGESAKGMLTSARQAYRQAIMKLMREHSEEFTDLTTWNNRKIQLIVGNLDFSQNRSLGDLIQGAQATWQALFALCKPHVELSYLMHPTIDAFERDSLEEIRKQVTARIRV